MTWELFIQHFATICSFNDEVHGTGSAQGPESQHHKFHVHLDDAIERGFLNLNRFHDQVQGLSLAAMMSPGQLTLSYRAVFTTFDSIKASDLFFLFT